jgi:VWFA-related protein
MKRETALALALLLGAFHAPAQTPAPPASQQPAPPATPAEDPDEDVVRITSNLVQFDAVVTDKQGRLVTDLRPEDFEVLLDGKPQEITNLSYVANESGTVTRQSIAGRDKTAAPVPPVPLRAGQVHRTIALVVDDLGTSFESLVQVRRALKKFVDEQMQPGDLVAIMQTGRGTGTLQQFTTDRQLLYRAIERVRWNPLGRAGAASFAAYETDSSGAVRDGQTGDAATNADADAAEPSNRDSRAESAELRDEIFTIGTLGALNFIVQGMKVLPGRKSVVMISDGVPFYKEGDQVGTNRVLEKLRRLADFANRASVVIYTMDARGLPALGLTAADNFAQTAATAGAGPLRDPRVLADLISSRSRGYFESQAGLKLLAEQTGGLFLHDTNDLGGSLQRVVDDQKGYYLIGFRPGEGVFDEVRARARFNKFEVKMRRDGLRVRTRAGFYGFTENQAKAAPPRTRSAQMVAAIKSPLTSGDLNLRLTSLFNSSAEKTGVVDSLLHIDMSRFKFTDEADGWKKAVVDVVAVTFGEDGQVVDELNRTETVRARGDALSNILANGVVYAMKVPVKKPGAYQLRVAVRDAATDKLGSASQFIEVPDLKQDRLALSGIFITAVPDAPKAGGGASQPRSTATDAANSLRNATVRRFRYGSQLEFLYHIYNARPARATARPELQTQVRLLRDGRPVYTVPLQPYDPGPQKDPSNIQAGGRLQLGASLQPGDYVLQVVVGDALAKGKGRTATQWIDFEIVK